MDDRDGGAVVLLRPVPRHDARADQAAEDGRRPLGPHYFYCSLHYFYCSLHFFYCSLPRASLSLASRTLIGRSSLVLLVFLAALLVVCIVSNIAITLIVFASALVVQGAIAIVFASALIATHCFAPVASLAGGRFVAVVHARAWPERARLARPLVEQPMAGEEGPLRPVPRRHAEGLASWFWCSGDVCFMCKLK